MLVCISIAFRNNCHRVFTLCFLLMFQMVYSQSVYPTLGEVQEVAINIIYQENLVIESREKIKVLSIDTLSVKDNPIVYIVNLEPTSFVIVSGLKACTPVLGFSIRNHFHKDEIFLNSSSFMVEYLKELRSIDLMLEKEINEDWNSLSSSNFNRVKYQNRDFRDVQPLLSEIEWGQGKYYNADCPADPASSANLDSRVPVGCTAVAAGQIMKYYNHPRTGSDTFDFVNDYSSGTFHFGKENYSWSAMSDKLFSYNSDLSRALYSIGIGFRMSYSASSSGSNLTNVYYGLKKYFRYNFDLKAISRNGYSTDEWVKLIKQELDNSRPIYYQGHRNRNSGHAWVIDGYKKNFLNQTLYHINWGWNGVQNGWFLLDDILLQLPWNNHITFSKDHSMIINLVPRTADVVNVVASDEDFNDKIAVSWDKGSIGPKGKFFKIFRSETDDKELATPISDWIRSSTTFEDKEVEQSKEYYYYIQASQSEDGDNPSSLSDPDIGSLKDRLTCNELKFTSKFDYFDDGNPNANYDNNLRCTYLIEPENANYIQLKFTSFNTEYKFDVLNVYKDENREVLLASYSGNILPEDLTVETNALFLEFISDATITESGWTALYTSSNTPINDTSFDEPCGAIDLPLLNYQRFLNGDNANATTSQNPEPGWFCGQYSDKDVWYRVTLPGDRLFKIIMKSGTLDDAVISAYISGDCLRYEFQDICQDDPSYFNLMPNWELIASSVNDTPFDGYFRVWGAEGKSGTFEICALDLGPYLVDNELDTDRNNDQNFIRSKFKLNDFQKNKNSTLEIKIYPNPASDLLNIESNTGDLFNLTILTVSGKIAFASKKLLGRASLNTSNWQKGTYIVKSAFANKVFVNKIIIN